MPSGSESTIRGPAKFPLLGERVRLRADRSQTEKEEKKNKRKK
jgi:hypothetical protein